MFSFYILMLITGLLVATLILVPLLRTARRRSLSARPLPEALRHLLETRWRLYRYLPDTVRGEVDRRLQMLLAETRFYGCQGLEVTEAMKVLILAQASLVYEHRSLDAPPNVLLYPDAFVRDSDVVDELGLVSHEHHALLGESWEQGRVILSWADIEQDLQHLDGNNLVIHEYAHQVDGGDGVINGIPVVTEAQRVRWQPVMQSAYEQLQALLDRGLEPPIDPYAATAPAEFFAVISEYFFTRPELLTQAFPNVYAELTAFYGVDPGTWHLPQDSMGNEPEMPDAIPAPTRHRSNHS